MNLTKQECEEALDNVAYIDYGCCDSETYDKNVKVLNELIDQHFDNPQIDWLRNCMGDKAFNLIFSNQEEVKKWLDRIRWHVKKCDELGRELDRLKSNPPLKFEELKEGMWIWDNYWEQYFEICEIYPDTKEFDILIHQNRINKLRYDPMKFEENRFYRKQVEE